LTCLPALRPTGVLIALTAGRSTAAACRASAPRSAAGLTADAFQVSTTSGGGALNVTVSGECGFFKTVPNAFASAGNINIATNAMILDLNYG